MLAGAARRERVPSIKGEVGARLRRVEELRGGLRLLLCDVDDARAGRCVSELGEGRSLWKKRYNRCQARIDGSVRCGCRTKVLRGFEFSGPLHGQAGRVRECPLGSANVRLLTTITAPGRSSSCQVA